MANFVCLHSCCHLTFGNLARTVACGQFHFFLVEFVSSPDSLLQTTLFGFLALQGTVLI